MKRKRGIPCLSAVVLLAVFSCDNPVSNDASYTITASIHGPGRMTPKGSITVEYGAEQQYTYSAKTGAQLDSVLVDGSKLSTPGSAYLFKKVSANHTIDAWFSSADGFDRRYIPDNVLAKKATAYSGYREGQSPETGVYPSEDQIKEDLELLVQGGWGFIRLFDCSPHAERVLKVIKENSLDLHVMLGIWIYGRKAIYDALNQQQIAKCDTLASTYEDIVVAVSVGNETLDYWSNIRVPALEMADYITQVRGLVSQPVTTDDSWIPFTFDTDAGFSYDTVVQVAAAVDFLSLHDYAMLDASWESWDWQQLTTPAGTQRAEAMMKAAMAYTKSAMSQVYFALLARGYAIPTLIGEAGWKDSTNGRSDSPEDSIRKYLVHPVNQKMFYDDFMDWVYGDGQDFYSPEAAFYFEAFDEPWKGQGSDDDRWGLFDVNRKAKYVIWDLLPELRPDNAPDYTEDDAVSYPY